MILQALQQNPIIGMIASFSASIATIFANVPEELIGFKEALGIIATIVGILIGIVTLALKVQEFIKKQKEAKE